MKKRLDWVLYEGMRLRAIELDKKGFSRKSMMEIFGVSKSTLSRWFSRHDAANPEWYKTLPMGGKKGKLSSDELRQLIEELNKGCTVHGFEGEVWTRGRVGVVIERLFGIKYDPAHVGRLLKKAGVTNHQKCTTCLHQKCTTGKS